MWNDTPLFSLIGAVILAICLAISGCTNVVTPDAHESLPNQTLPSANLVDFPVTVDIHGVLQHQNYSDIVKGDLTIIPLIHPQVINNSDFLGCGWNGNFSDSAKILFADPRVKEMLRHGGVIIGLDYYVPFLRPRYEKSQCWKMGPSLTIHYDEKEIMYVLNLDRIPPQIEDVYINDLCGV